MRQSIKEFDIALVASFYRFEASVQCYVFCLLGLDKSSFFLSLLPRVKVSLCVDVSWFHLPRSIFFKIVRSGIVKNTGNEIFMIGHTSIDLNLDFEPDSVLFRHSHVDQTALNHS